MEFESTVNGKYLVYKGKPLVRDGNQFCYGDMSTDKYVMYLMVLSSKNISIDGVDTAIPDKVIAQIIKSETGVSEMDRIVKQFPPMAFAEAFDTAIGYLEKMLAK